MENNLKYVTKEVYENKKISHNIYSLEIEGNFEGIPGQFYMLRCWDMELVLGRPISIHDLEEGRITFLYQVVGKGTEKLRRLKKGDKINLLGPLGNGFKREVPKGKIAVVTGGIGIAPMFYLAADMKNQNFNAGGNREDYELDLYSGFRDDVYSVGKFKPYVDNVYISTETGSQGSRGYVTDKFQPETYDVVFCCGPRPMIKKVVEECAKKNVKVYVSMEEHMACGIGACLGCTCSTVKGNKRVCKDGPVFPGREIIW
ncbi:MAG: dihydroorotate dehydrogenase electron transfer subunit [Clostridium luticellarii]|uniref:Dihydroorotate dehydrogenase B (NAD(+)), electron transfer subunit n=1 Tax=Clostridium luticellarii TaxID=1691940 RepID=A0A2T0BQA7_9CLOT|nr:dihydroorotate dehydrogenase electron transfer subunit [Clostridium luticellarii]MCI1944442.1 dihydroorotate dehydrogenase electron transfer subunit [Clostridium luticellarii]MCI1967941.1 dihydroorotate dehydrogenase electron transfer subunit [Clostridium luticellarii]MCI1995120.1 dihydroorotate dehydrogenase electron transfer subunit [Clostridium luticellarii]MCI2039279.1 dihydroorotate dehydrogenase electron transfer subunit [Clostridium luticellarii]PRR86059.1 Dihydroorotate dehydrogenas